MRSMGVKDAAPGGPRSAWAQRGTGLIVLMLLACAAPIAAQQKAFGPSLRSPSLRSIDSLAQAAGQTVKVRGSVTLLTPSSIVIEDESGALDVRPSPGSDAVSIGDEVEVTGRTMAGAPHATLGGAVARLWSGSPPLPVVISPDRAAEGRNPLELVNLSGRLASTQRTARGALELTLEGEHQFFTASLAAGTPASERWPDPGALAHALRSGATLQLTGVLDAAQPSGSAQGSFTLALRSADDLVLLDGPPWWTLGHVTAVFAAMILLVFAAVAVHVRSLRLRFRAVTDERLRIARDIHDTMAQGFAGIALQLQAAQQVLPAAAAAEARQHLDMALLMVRHSRGESHRSIQMLRSLAASDSLTKMLEQSAQQLGEGASARIEVQVQGSEPPLPYDIAMQLYRIGQEGVANAVQHAQARSIRLLLEFRRQEIALAVSDDGHGFDPARIEANGEHFGLAGMQERVDGLRGRLRVQSSAAGSTLLVEIPWPA